MDAIKVQQTELAASLQQTMSAQFNNSALLDASLASLTPATNAGQATTSDEFNLKVAVLLTVIYTLIFLVGLVGNFCFCYVIVVDSKCNSRMKSATNYYLFSLSISDMLLLSMGLPHDVAQLWSPGRYLFGRFVCVARGWIVEAAACASVLVIVAFTVERYVAICHPLRSSVIRADSLARSIKTIVSIWLIASCCAAFVVKQYDVVESKQQHATQNAPQPTNATATANSRLVECIPVQIDKTAFELSSLLFFALPMTSITVLYGNIVLKLRQRGNWQSESHSHGDARRLRVAQLKASCSLARARNKTMPTKLNKSCGNTSAAVSVADYHVCSRANSCSSNSRNRSNDANSAPVAGDVAQQLQATSSCLLADCSSRRCFSASSGSALAKANALRVEHKLRPTRSQNIDVDSNVSDSIADHCNSAALVDGADSRSTKARGKQLQLNSNLTTNVKSMIKMLG